VRFIYRDGAIIQPPFMQVHLTYLRSVVIIDLNLPV
jgi:hypothetical protein